MSRVEERDLGFGVVERRTYDENDKLVDIRKIYPSTKVNETSLITRIPGSSGGHQF